MDDLRYRRAKLLKDLMASPVFTEACHAVMQDIAVEMMASKPAEKELREALYYENEAFARLVGRLTAIANETVMTDNKKDLAGV
jgi:hypothetical protein